MMMWTLSRSVLLFLFVAIGIELSENCRKRELKRLVFSQVRGLEYSMHIIKFLMSTVD
jgi:hypothetical protein